MVGQGLHADGGGGKELQHLLEDGGSGPPSESIEGDGTEVVGELEMTGGDQVTPENPGGGAAVRPKDVELVVLSEDRSRSGCENARRRDEPYYPTPCCDTAKREATEPSHDTPQRTRTATSHAL